MTFAIMYVINAQVSYNGTVLIGLKVIKAQV